MDKFETYSNKKLAPHAKGILVFLGIVISIYGFLSKDYINIWISLFLIYISFYEKMVVITAEGINFHRKGLNFTSNDIFPFTRITNIRIENLSQKTSLHFMENHMVRRIVVDSKYVGDIIDLAKKKNQDIYIDYV